MENKAARSSAFKIIYKRNSNNHIHLFKIVSTKWVFNVYYMIYLKNTIILPHNYDSIISLYEYMLIIYDCMIYHRISLCCYISYIINTMNNHIIISYI